MIITLCGSARFEALFREWNKKLSLKGHVVLTMSSFPSENAGNKDWYSPEQKETLDLVHKRKIAISDAILVLNSNGYIGKSTQSEREFAEERGKLIYYLETMDVSRSACKLEQIETSGPTW